jgi:hypothetical protein
METLLGGNKEPSESLRNSTASAAERPVLLFGEIGDHKGPLERLLRSLQWSAFFAEARVAVLLFCLIAVLLGLLFTPWSGLSGVFKGESGSLSTKLPNLQSNSEPGRDQCCAPGMVPGADGYCCKVDPALPPDSELRRALDNAALQRALAERAKAELEAWKQEQTLKDAQANARRGSNQTPSPIGKKLVEALAKIPPPFWAASLSVPALLIMFTILGSAFDGKTLAYLAEMAEIASEAERPGTAVSLQALRRAAHNGSLRALIREFIFQCYPSGGFNRRHLRAIANDIFDVLDGDIVELVRLFSSHDALVALARSHAFRKLRNALALPQSFAANRVDWLREIASRTFLMKLAGAAAFRFVLQQQGDRPGVWLPLLSALSRLFKRSDGKSAESSSGKDAAMLILILLLLSLLPLAGGYFGASRSVRSIENDQQKQSTPRDGRDGRDGQNGQNGKNGETGQNGQNGRDGRDGKDCSDCKSDKGGTDQGGKDGKSSNPSSTSNSPSAIASVTLPNPSNTPENPRQPQTYPGGEVLVPLTPDDVNGASKSDGVHFSISYHDPDQPVAYTARLEAHGTRWPPDPLIMSVTKQGSDAPAEVAVTARKSYSDFLNADVWLEERHSKGWHNLWHGQDLVVVHILPRDAASSTAPGPVTDKKP